MNPTDDTGVLSCAIDMRFTVDEVERGLGLLLSVLGRTEAKAGCESCSVGRDAAQPALIHYLETWTAETAFRRHVRSEEFRRILVAMDMCCEEPRVAVGRFAGRAVIDFLRDLRDGELPAAGPADAGPDLRERRAETDERPRRQTLEE